MELMSFDYMIANKILLDTGDVCTIHDKPYYRRMTQEGEYTSIAICLECQKSELERLKRSSAEQQTINGMLAKTWNMFESVSIIPDDLKNATMNNFETNNLEDQKALGDKNGITYFRFCADRKISDEMFEQLKQQLDKELTQM